MEALTDWDYILLNSLEGGRKYLDMGRSPVDAIGRAFALIELGLITANGDWLTLTTKGRSVIKEKSGAAEK